VDQVRRRAGVDGEGSLYRRTRLGPDGKPYLRWVAQISLGGRDDRRIVRRICPTKSDAKAALAELLRPVEPVPPQREQPLGAYLRRWLDETAAPSLSPSTLRGYRDALAHLEPIADIPIGQLQPEDIERALAAMTTRRAHAKRQKPAAPKTVRNVQIFLRRALGQAEQRGHITRNVAKMVPLRRVPRHHVEALTPERAKEILSAVKGDATRPPMPSRSVACVPRRSSGSPGPTSTRRGPSRPSGTSSRGQGRGPLASSSRPRPPRNRCRSPRS